MVSKFSRIQDEAYYERRRRNNDAAKRSRDARRVKEEAIAARAAHLERENSQLRAQVAILRSETARLQLLLFSRQHLTNDTKIDTQTKSNDTLTENISITATTVAQSDVEMKQ
ncbi:basic region leucine zipper [Dictyocaulus viviparus]|uniref:Basic region leucine zipper n=1 Tax=Dictyocaulus viviparus TaxID=29172 RepID=A0A0D8XTR3_DICVI|nr:basic region leucine zipper [Dictyocaulus viviparus]